MCNVHRSSTEGWRTQSRQKFKVTVWRMCTSCCRTRPYRNARINMLCWNYAGLTEVRTQGQTCCAGTMQGWPRWERKDKHVVLELRRADRGENARTNMLCWNYAGLTEVRTQGQTWGAGTTQGWSRWECKDNMRCWNYTGLIKVRMQGQHEVLELSLADQGENARTTWGAGTKPSWPRWECKDNMRGWN